MFAYLTLWLLGWFLWAVDSHPHSHPYSLPHPHSHSHTQVAGIMSDVYDSPQWAKVMGPPTRRLTRVALLGCVDGIPAFRIGGLSLVPSEWIFLNFAPEYRNRAGNIIIHMLLDSTLSANAMRKYYKFAANYEMNQLNQVGVDGVRFIVFANTLDTKGVSIPSIHPFYSMHPCILFHPYIHVPIYIRKGKTLQHADMSIIHSVLALSARKRRSSSQFRDSTYI